METPSSSRRLTLIILCVLGALCLLTFWRVVHADFVPFDDDIEILNNAHLRAGFTLQNVAWMFSDTLQTERYTPLSWMAWTSICSIWGLRAAAFHAHALVTHMVNTGLVFFALRRGVLLAGFEEKSAKAQAAAGIGAALWSVHPLRVEVVSWVTQVRFAEATTFALLAFLLYPGCCEGSPRRAMARPRYWGAVGCYAVSILFYPNGICLPAILFLMQVVVCRKRALVAGLEMLPFLVPALFAAGMTIYGRFANPESAHAPVTLQQFDLSHRVMQAAYMYVYFLWKSFDVTHISPVYSTLVHFEPFSPLFLLCLLAVIGLTIAALVFRQAYRGFTFFWLSHLVLMLPVGGYFEFPYYPSDRYGYLDGVLLTAVLVLMGLQWVQRVRGASAAVALVGACCLVAGMSLLSAAETLVWQNGEALYRHVLAELGSDPYAVDIHVRFARYYLEQHQLEAAIVEENAALRIWPGYPPAVRMRETLVRALAGARNGTSSQWGVPEIPATQP